jgi:hypothetical protein
VRAGFDKWWLLPLGVLTASALVALGLVLFGPSFVGNSSAEGVARPAASEAAVADCSGASKLDYACYQERYRALVLNSGVEAAFEELKEEHEENGFVRTACHHLTHVIGRTATELYGGLPGAFAHGDPFCSAGYYHGAAEAVVTKIGADQALAEPDALCADLGEYQRYSIYHRNCAHGLGHGFMGAFESELFEALEGCDALTDGWERESCYGGVFMENAMPSVNPNRPSKYLKADRPLYPCTDVEARYKNMCYQKQTAYAVYTQHDDYVKVFDLCSEVAGEDFRPSCYRGLGTNAAVRGIKYVGGEVAKTESTRKLCMLGKDYEARSNCAWGAVRAIINYYHGEEQAKALCESLEADLRAACLQAVEDKKTWPD